MTLTSRRALFAVMSVMPEVLGRESAGIMVPATPQVHMGEGGAAMRRRFAGSIRGLRARCEGEGATAPSPELDQLPRQERRNGQQNLAGALQKRERQRNLGAEAEDRAERDIAAFLHAHRRGDCEGGASQSESKALKDQHLAQTERRMEEPKRKPGLAGARDP